MISKERLEELIKQGATIYEVKYNNINPVSLKNKIRFIHEKYQVITFEPRPDEKYKHHKYFDKLFETLEEAEWHKEFGCIKRTERLELPTWEQIENIIDKKKRFGLNHSDRILARIITKDSIYYFKLCKDIDLFTFQIEQTYIGEDLCEQITSRFPVSLGKATEENYIKACRKAKKLFLGEQYAT